MTVLLEAGKIRLSGNCPVEDAEPLLMLLLSHPGCPVDIGDATHLHAAVLQVLLVFKREVAENSRDSFLQKWITPILADRIASSS